MDRTQVALLVVSFSALARPLAFRHALPRLCPIRSNLFSVTPVASKKAFKMISMGLGLTGEQCPTLPHPSRWALGSQPNEQDYWQPRVGFVRHHHGRDRSHTRKCSVSKRSAGMKSLKRMQSPLASPSELRKSSAEDHPREATDLRAYNATMEITIAGDAKRKNRRALPKGDQLAIFRRDGWMCQWCKKPVIFAPVMKLLEVEVRRAS